MLGNVDSLRDCLLFARGRFRLKTAALLPCCVWIRPFQFGRLIMFQRFFALFMVSLCMVATASQSHAGGLLKRLCGKAIPCRVTAFKRSCIAAPAPCRVTPQTCPTDTPMPDCPSDDMTLSARSSSSAQCYRQYLKNCAKCDAIYSDPAQRQKCRSIALQLYKQCLNPRPPAAGPRVCACQYPVDPSGSNCMAAFEGDSASLDSDVRRCAPLCYFGCLNMIGQLPLDAMQPPHQVSQ